MGRTEFVGEAQSRRRENSKKAAIAKATAPDVPVLLSEALRSDTARTDAVNHLATMTLEDAGQHVDVIPDIKGMVPRLTIPRNLAVPDPKAPTAELTKLLCLLVSEGMPVAQAFRAAGVVRRVWETWWECGESDAAEGKNTPFSHMVVELMREDGNVEVCVLRDLLKRKAGTWQASMTLLERRSPHAYSLTGGAKQMGDAARGLLDYFVQAGADRGIKLD